MFSRIFKSSNSITFQSRIVLRRAFATAPSNGTSKAAELLTSAVQLTKLGVNLLPAGITKPLCKLVNMFSGVTYQLSVFGNVFKQVAKYQNYKLPTKMDFTVAQTELFALLNKVNFKNLAATFKNPDVKSLKSYGLLTAELGALFFIGEQVGRRKIIGYEH
ncbi:hypothetical protein AYI70_g6062 [Smittium culicis]|uniref:ATP synthase subunit g, mitochondrial n=1 Tax=Smittium culicis TaxID=133412 RepID=A0A1R1XRQ0_9FUNG|nr:hypothetical protein AYI70_g6062 [Smittium culicis]